MRNNLVRFIIIFLLIEDVKKFENQFMFFVFLVVCSLLRGLFSVLVSFVKVVIKFMDIDKDY